MSDQYKVFIDRWAASGGSERANFQMFALELMDLLGVDRPDSGTEGDQASDYRFERPVRFGETSTQNRGYIDLYRRGCFILEAKQGIHADARPDPNQPTLFREEDAPRLTSQGHGKRGSRAWARTMLEARGQADGYARAVAKEDGWPPFLMIVDVGYVIELFADFSRQGQGYTQFPDRNRYQIKLQDLADPETRTLLRTIWSDPYALDPSKISARVTREISTQLAELGKSLEGDGHDSEAVARFLMRCLFSMFAEDVELIPRESFTDLLKRLRGQPEMAATMLTELWEKMNTGGTSVALMTKLKRFNGGLFKDADALPLNAMQLGLLINAASQDWKTVEPAIFGTLLERALDVRQRHKLGAHYTPRAYVQRLVTPTIMDPLRGDWRDVLAGVQRLSADGKDAEARDLVRDFHRKLCEIRVLDPACGSGNFLYVALEMMKRLEGEVVAQLTELGEDQGTLGLSGMTVDPHQFLGIELNPWAAAVAELVLWIGYLQWHFRTYGEAAPSEPVLKDFRNIECRDAVLEWSDTRPRLDEAGNPVTRWDGITTVTHQVTGEEVPDPEARVQVFDYLDPKDATWPEAEFIVGNPPFIGNKRMRESLGDGYVEALRGAYKKVPESADLVMFWWEKAALAARGWNAKTGKGTRRFGLITTNSLRQVFNRRVIEPHLADPKKPLSLLFAIPDHPWVDTLYGAAVRIAMTVGVAGNRAGHLSVVVSEEKRKDEEEGREVQFDREIGKVFSNLRLGADVASAIPLKSNISLCFQGVIPGSKGFRAKQSELGKLGVVKGALPSFVKRYIIGNDLISIREPEYIIDFFGMDEAGIREKYPVQFQILHDRVQPDKERSNEDRTRHAFWSFIRPRPEMRNALRGLQVYIATPYTSKHRFFVLCPASYLPDAMVYPICISDIECLSVLSSRLHVCWTLAQGGTLEDRPRYNNSVCFDPFPFPDLTDAQRATLRDLGEQLEKHRKDRQAEHPKLTLTQMYNVLEKLRAGEVIEGKDKEIYGQGLIGILKGLHDKIDTAVAEAYGWPVDLSDEEILQRLVDLNHERAAEEARGHIRWLRPEYQNPEGKAAEASKQSGKLDLGESIAATDKAPWPKTLPDQIAAVRDALHELGEATPDQIARRFKRARVTTVQPLLDSLTAIGGAHQTEEGRYAA